MIRFSEASNLDNKYRGKIPDICLSDISVIIPVKNNQKGVDRFIEAFFATHSQDQYPKEIIIVDNNSALPIKLRDEYLQKGLPLRLYSCSRQGPAAARNCGVKASLGEWLLFCDSDCIPTPSLLTGYLNSPNSAVAYAGKVKATSATYLARYYDDEETLLPHRKCNTSDMSVPLYITLLTS